MIRHTAEERAALKNATLQFLDRLRAAFPLEQRIRAADSAARNAYGRVLAKWICGEVPDRDFLSPAELHALCQLDAVVPGPAGLGCYPFSTDDRGISVRFGRYQANAMCAIDALAISRLAGLASVVDAHCSVCLVPVNGQVQADGSLDHDAWPDVRVLWRHAVRAPGSCSESICRDLVFICQKCAASEGCDCLTLPQATAVANAFFRFQREFAPPQST